MGSCIVARQGRTRKLGTTGWRLPGRRVPGGGGGAGGRWRPAARWRSGTRKIVPTRNGVASRSPHEIFATWHGGEMISQNARSSAKEGTQIGRASGRERGEISGGA